MFRCDVFDAPNDAHVDQRLTANAREETEEPVEVRAGHERTRLPSQN